MIGLVVKLPIDPMFLDCHNLYSKTPNRNSCMKYVFIISIILAGCSSFVRVATGKRMVCINGLGVVKANLRLTDCAKLCGLEAAQGDGCSVFNYNQSWCEIINDSRDCIEIDEEHTDIYSYT